MNDSIKREQSHACMSYADREQGRTKFNEVYKRGNFALKFNNVYQVTHKNKER